MLREARALGSELPVIFLTGERDRDVDQAVLAARAADYLVKGQPTGPLLDRALRYALAAATAAAALRASEARLRAQYKSFPIPTYTWQRQDDDFVLVDCNDAAMAITQGTVASLLGATCRELYHDRPEIAADFARCYAERTSIRREMPYQLRVTGEEKRLITTYVYAPPDLVTVHTEDITARHAVEAARAYLSAIVESSADAIVGRSPEGIITSWNAAAERLFGYTAAEAVGRPITQLIPPERADEYSGILPRLAAGERIAPFETERTHRDGRRIAVSITVSPVLDAAGQVVGVASVSRDISERKATEAALRHSEERLRSLVRHATDIIAIVAADGPVRYISPAVERVLGFPADTYLGAQGFAETHPDDTAATQQFFAALLAAPELNQTVAMRARHRDGSWRTLELVGTNLLADPSVEGIVINGRDITERQWAEEELRHSEATLAEAQRMAHLGSWEVDLVTGEAHWSDELYRILGLRPGTTLPSYPDALAAIHPDDRAHADMLVQRARREGVPRDLEYRIVRPDGTIRVVQNRSEVVLDADGTPRRRVGTLLDITERKALEDQLHHLAFHDALTGLPNRALFLDRLAHALARAARHRAAIAVLFVDLDGFKSVNDSLGHDVGDRLLVAVAERLHGCVRTEDTVARLGGDEFIILLESVGGVLDALGVAERISAALRQPFALVHPGLYLSTSIGIARDEGGRVSATELVRQADVAMHQAKHASKARYALFEPDMDSEHPRSATSVRAARPRATTVPA